MKSVSIISAWGRGIYLAYQLKQKGFNVTIYDVSSLLPSLSSAEREGPFGIFLPENLSDLQKKYLCGGSFYSVQQGFSVLSSQSLMEFQGSLRSFFIETRKDFELCYSILSHLPDLSEKEKRSFIRQKIKENNSSQLLFMARELTNSFIHDDKKRKKNISFTEVLENQKAFPFLDFSPLFSEYVLRESSQRHFIELKQTLCEEGVKWVDILSSQCDKTISPIRFKINKRNIQVKWNEQEESSCFLIWTLSGSETKQYFCNEMSWLFPNWTEPVKIWRKFSLLWDQKGFEDIVPSLLLIVPNSEELREKGMNFPLFSPQAQGRLISIKKTPAASQVDVWTLCSYAEHLNKQVLTNCLQLIMKHLQSLFPGFSMEGRLPDVNTCHNYFLLYGEKSKSWAKLFQKKVPSFVFHLNPEGAGKLDAYSLMQQSDWIFKKIIGLSK